jgi:hypothetical protein
VDVDGELLRLVTALIIKKRALAGRGLAEKRQVIEVMAGHGRGYGLAVLKEILVSAKFACPQLS